ncbi:mitochondrial export translocase Oxa2 [Zalerion maritima]|uniref:Mitochondrial export translocase Oxa2 n=1 Tax=Zalerion maritima TaxID=339359 RepID=A0AAD5RGP9_9PEZI|nr:mitochondrial export translocase Oxa2 [Zalerion maritima]
MTSLTCLPRRGLRTSTTPPIITLFRAISPCPCCPHTPSLVALVTLTGALPRHYTTITGNFPFGVTRPSLNPQRQQSEHQRHLDFVLNNCQHPIPSSRRYFIESTFAASHAVITSLHAVTPWYLTIPLFSLVVNLVCRYPFAIKVHSIRLRQARLRSLESLFVRAYVAADRDQRESIEGPGSRVNVGVKEFKRLHGTTDRGWVVLSAALTFPAWVFGGETIRRVTGSSVGLVGLIVGGDGDSQFKYLADPAMATEGLPWAMDLTTGDPYHVLPLVLGLAMLARAAPRNKKELIELFSLSGHQGNSVGVSSMGSRVLKRYSLVFSAIFPMLIWNLEAALQLYWLSTIVCSSVGSAAIMSYMTRNNAYLVWIRKTRLGPDKGIDYPGVMNKHP